jgi:hypothetical protein
MNSRPHVLPSSRGSHPTTSLKDHTYHIVEKAVLCIAAFWPTRLPQRVISLGGDRGRGSVYVRSTSDRVEILCTAAKDAKCQKPTYALQQRTAYSITSSARASSVGGTSMPSAFAVFKLMASSYLVGACTGRSAGFSPLRMRST